MSSALRIARVAVAVAAVVALLTLLRRTDGARLWGLMAARGPTMALVLLPFLVGMAVDTIGWRAVLARLGRPLPFFSLLRIRLATEGAMLSLPGGSLAGEALKPMLLDRVHGVPVSAGTASVLIKKSLVVLSNGIYLGLGLLAGAGMIRAAAPAAGPALTTAALGGAVACLALGGASVAALRGGPWWRRRVPRLAATVDLAAGFFRGRPRTVLICFGLFLAVWLVEAMETLVIARLLGLRLTVGGALGFESLIALGRAVGFFLPAGLGVQDLGHLLLARSVGANDADIAGAALIFTKRSKEVFWIVTGAFLLSGTRRAGDSNARAG
jgi:lysylphosphatidylglycerol synthase-like protein